MTRRAADSMGHKQYYNFWGHKILLMAFRDSGLATRFTINGTNQNLWIPNRHLDECGRIKKGQNIDYVIVQSRNQIILSGAIKKSLFKPSVEDFLEAPIKQGE